MMPLNQSSEKTDKQWTAIHALGQEAMENKTVLIRARLHNSRGTGQVDGLIRDQSDGHVDGHRAHSLSLYLIGKQVFLVFRQSSDTLQGIAAVDDKLISREMVKFASR